MKALLITSGLSLLLATGVLAADSATDPTVTPGNAPTKSMDAATPEMKGPGTGEHPPTDSMDKAVPTMKSGDKVPDSKDSTTTAPPQKSGADSATKAMDAATPTTTAPSTKPGVDTPTKAVGSAVPEMKSPGDPNAEHPPAAAMDKAVPPMKPDDKSGASEDAITPKQ